MIPAGQTPKLCSLFHDENNKIMEKTKKITAICFGGSVLKYHISNKPTDVHRFEIFLRKKGVKYVNYYDTATKQYLHRKWL